MADEHIKDGGMDPAEAALRAELTEKEEARNEQQASASAEGDSGKHRRRHHHHHHHHSGKRRRKHRHSKRMKRVKKILLIILVLLVTAALVAGASLFAMYYQGKEQVTEKNVNIRAPENVVVGQKGQYVVYNNERYNYNNDIITILFLGIDRVDSTTKSEVYITNYMSDVISLFVINKKTGVIDIINVPRDIITDVGVYSPDGGYVGLEKQAIAAAFAYGDGEKKSCMNSADAVSRLFYNIPIKTYVSLNLDGFQDINDSVGGVDVVSPETISFFTEGEEYHLDGVMAREFIQARAKDRPDANLLRNKRQQVYCNEFLKKMIARTKSDVSVPVNLFNASAPYSCTNLNAERITYLATEYVVNRDMKFHYSSVPVEVKQVGDNAQNYVKEKEFYEMFLKVFYTKAEKN